MQPAHAGLWRSSLISQVIPLVRLGQTATEFTHVTGVDQVVRGGVIAWRHRPVITGGAAAPDPPPRILAPEPLKAGVVVAAAVAGVHRGRRRSEAAVGVPAELIVMAFASMPQVDGRTWVAVLRRAGGGAAPWAASFAGRSAMPVPVAGRAWRGLPMPARLGGWLEATGAAPQRHLSGRVAGNHGARPGCAEPRAGKRPSPDETPALPGLLHLGGCRIARPVVNCHTRSSGAGPHAWHLVHR
jgi:hypothetical protein